MCQFTQPKHRRSAGSISQVIFVISAIFFIYGCEPTDRMTMNMLNVSSIKSNYKLNQNEIKVIRLAIIKHVEGRKVQDINDPNAIRIGDNVKVCGTVVAAISANDAESTAPLFFSGVLSRTAREFAVLFVGHYGAANVDIERMCK